MKVVYGFSSQFCGGVHKVVTDIPEDTTDDEIIKSFEDVLGIPYNEECFFYKCEETTA